MALLESIICDLHTLPAAKLLSVAAYINQLNPKVKTKKERLVQLMRTAGRMSKEEANEFEQALRESDQINGTNSAYTW